MKTLSIWAASAFQGSMMAMDVGSFACTVSQQATLNGKVEAGIRCLPNRHKAIHGGLRVDPAHPYHSVYEDGARYFLLGYEADWLWGADRQDPDRKLMRHLIDRGWCAMPGRTGARVCLLRGRQSTHTQPARVGCARKGARGVDRHMDRQTRAGEIKSRAGRGSGGACDFGCIISLPGRKR